MLHFLYHKDYNWERFVISGGEEGKATLHVRVFVLAPTYLIEPLTDLAGEKALAALDIWDDIDFAYAPYEVFTSTHKRP